MQTFKRTFGLLRPYSKLLILALVAVVVANSTRLIMPLFTRTIIDDVINKGMYELLWPTCWAILGFTVVRSLLLYARAMWFERLSQNAVYSLRTDLYDHLQGMAYEFYDKNRIGEIMSRMTGDIEAIRNLFGGGVITVVESLIFVLGSVVFLFTLSPLLTLIVLAFCPIVAWLAIRFHKQIHQRYIAIREQNAVLNTRTQENISGMRVVKAFAREDTEEERFEVDNQQLLKLHMMAVKVNSVYGPILDFLGSAIMPTLILVGGGMVMAGLLSLGTLLAFTGYIWMIIGPMRNLANIVNMLTQSFTSSEKLFYYLDLGTTIKDKPQTKQPKEFRGHVRFENVTFRYDDTTVLEDINLDVPAGHTVAVLGATGSGKTTLVSLLGRFYDVRKGQVTVDGIDVRDYPLKELRRHIGYVNQETFLFSETVGANISFGRPGIGQEAIERAARVADADAFVRAMPDGYETIVGERGMGLSGGQKQRVALARAVLIDPQILVLDDATSAVDMETEAQIQQAMEEVLPGRTTFIIAHRISSVRKANLIIFLENGRIVEQGTHKELLAKKGRYWDMYQEQTRDFVETAEGEV